MLVRWILMDEYLKLILGKIHPIQRGGKNYPPPPNKLRRTRKILKLTQIYKSPPLLTFTNDENKRFPLIPYA